MLQKSFRKSGWKTVLLSGTILGATLLTTAQAQAQVAAEDDAKLEEIVVTAQKREQNLQDVPIAVTALSQSALEANRVVTINDLSGLAPGVQVRAAAGGTQLASFTIRGAVSYGVVPGSDKEVSNYLDGVYLSSPRGSIFELPDVTRIEILRGPQGTLFGRNATAGAVSITTRDPSGEFGVKQEFTFGNLRQFRSSTSLDLPKFGSFSAYVSYVHSYKRGDIRNANPGVVWDRTASGLGKQTSVKYLGTKDADTFFGALKFEQGGFSTVYKFDHSRDNGSPEGTGLVNYDPAYPLVGDLMTALLTSQPGPVYIATDGKRPDVVNNSFVTPFKQRSTGHNLTSTYEISDNLSVKNVFAYRTSYINSNSALAGFDGLTFTAAALVPYATLSAFSVDPSLATASPDVQAATIGGYATALAPLIGSPIVGIGISVTAQNKQWSDEFQLNYRSDLATVTAGAIWFHSKDVVQGPPGAQNTNQFRIFPGGVVALGAEGLAQNEATSLAAYTQVELHATPKLDIIGGIRVTKDKKTGTFTYDSLDLTTIPRKTLSEIPYDKTKLNYLIGLNYKLNDDTLLYGKYSTSFVSGGPGATAALVYAPETATSWEAGLKADMFDHRLRTNLAAYTVTYKHVQSAQGTAILGPLLGEVGPYLGTFILDQGGIKNSGVELEVSGAPSRGLSLGGSLNYNRSTFNNINPLLLATNGGGYAVTLRPEWSAGLSAQYESQPVFADATINFRVDGNWHSKARTQLNPFDTNPLFASVRFQPAAWIINGRLALENIDIAGSKAQIAAWAKNLTDDRSATFPELFGFAAAANYQPARTFGVDLRIEIR